MSDQHDVPQEEGPEDPPSPTDAQESLLRDAADEGDEGAATPGDDAPDGAAGQVAGGPGAALARVTGGQVRTPQPPKRTGVFLDPDDLRSHVGGLLRSILGSYEVDPMGNFTFAHDDARVFVTVGPSPIGPQVGVFSVTNLDVDLSADLGSFLLGLNHQLGFGSFSYDPDNRAVWLRHTLLGTTLDGPELHAAVAAVARTAAHFDEAIRDRFGGRTFSDAPEEVQQRAHPPEPMDDGAPNAMGYL